MNHQCRACAVGPGRARPSDRRIIAGMRAYGERRRKTHPRNRDWSWLSTVTSQATRSYFFVYKIANCIQFVRLENNQPPGTLNGVRSA